VCILFSNIARTKRKKRMRWENNVELSGVKRNMYNFWLGKLKECCWRNMLAGDDNMKIEKEEMEFYGVTII